MGYKEEIFERVETQFSNMQQAYAWLSGFDRPSKNKYERAGFELSKDVGNYLEVEENLSSTNEYDKLNELKKYAQGISYSPLRQKILPEIQEKMDAISEELKDLTEERKEQRLLEEKEQKEKERLLREKEKYKQIQKETEDKRKRANANRNLEKISKRLLGFE